MKGLDILTSPNKRAVKNTLIGGILTIILIIFSLYLLINEYSNFKGTQISHNLYLDPNPKEDQIQVRFKIMIRHAPCAILSLDLLDDLRHH